MKFGQQTSRLQTRRDLQNGCACRQRKRVDPDSAQCDHPEEVCLHFGDLARYLVDSGLSREITKGEAKDILKIAADPLARPGASAVPFWQIGV